MVHSTLVRAVGDARTFADVARCYEDKVAFDVRVNRAFAVIGGNSGFQHHVRANAAGRCQVDPNGDPLARGRARLGCSFRNHSLQFQLPRAERTDDVQRIGVSLLAAFSSRAAKVVLRAYNLGFGTATVVPEQLRYNDVDGRLFLVDIYQRGLLPIPLDPFEPSLSTSGQFN